MPNQSKRLEDKCEDCRKSNRNDDNELLCNDSVISRIYWDKGRKAYCSSANPTNNCERYSKRGFFRR